MRNAELRKRQTNGIENAGFRKHSAPFDKLRAGLRTPNSAFGFTLLETLVAVAILGTAVAVSMAVLSTSLRNVSRAEDYERAVLLARSQMNELLALPAWRNGQVWRGDWGRSYRWIARVEKLREPGAPPEQQVSETVPGGREMMRVLLVAAWTTPRGEKQIELETVRLQLKPEKP